ncbi:hypothetical protein BVY03_04760, partial [bacterium K02(2017)]
GVAAVLLGGRTFHSFFGLGIMEGGAEDSIRRAFHDKKVIARIRKMEGFILDEVSMIPGQAFMAAEQICRLCLDAELPWGGLKVIVVGDFAQLPPINRNQKQKDWAFLNPAWEASEFKNISLKTMVRSRDEDFLNVINKIRDGIVDDSVSNYLNHKVDNDTDLFEGTCLFPFRNTTEKYNQKCLNQNDNDLYTFKTRYTGLKRFTAILQKTAPIPEILNIKENALVMTRINDPKYRFINGSTGNVVEINADEILIKLLNKKKVIEVPRSVFSLYNADGDEVATASNFPINLAYATTIHKSQGATLSQIMIDLKNLWEPGQAYVALSRLESGDGLKIRGWDAASIKTDPDVTAFHQAISSENL